jgi:hypothetical protein
MSIVGTWLETNLNKNGKYIFVYIVSGSEEELVDFRNKQGDFYRESSDGKPLYNTPFYGGKNVKIILNYAKTKYIIDNSEIDKKETLVNRFDEILNITLAEKTKDINWILDLENKISYSPERNKLSEEQLIKMKEIRKQIDSGNL